MTTIKIRAEDDLITVLKQIAKDQLTTVEAVSKEALLEYSRLHSCDAKAYSFIGIGHSGKGNLSTRVKATLGNGANRQEGWSMPK